MTGTVTALPRPPAGWGADDAILVYDYDHNGVVTSADELMLREYLPGATTDLEGLEAFDDNGDGVFSAEDAAWEDFGLWQDENSNGITDAGEFHTLNEHGITSIGLESDGNSDEIAGNTVFGTTHYQKEDGTVGEAGDVALRGEEIVLTEVDREIDVQEPGSPTTTDPEEESETGLAIHTDGEQEVGADPDLDPGFDEAEVNRVAQQFQSDAAVGFQTMDGNNGGGSDLYAADGLYEESNDDSLTVDDGQDDFLMAA